MTRGLLERLTLAARRRWRAVLAVFAVLVALSVWRIGSLGFDTDVLALLPREDPVVATFLDTLERFGSIDYLLVAVEIPEGEVLTPYLSYADALAGRLEALPEIEEIQYRIGSLDELARQFFPKAVLFLDEEGRRELEAKLGDEAVRARVRELRRLVATPQGSAMRDLLTLDPLGLSEIFMDRLEISQGGLALDWTSGYYLSGDHTLLLLLAEPTGPPQNVDFGKRLVDAVEAETAELTAGWPRLAGVDPEAEGISLEEEVPPAPEVRLGGSYLTALDDAGFIVRDMIVNIATSAVGVLALFLLAFRRLGPLLYAAVPLACGLVLTFGFAGVTLGSLSSATSGTAALLIGLGIDFVIVSYGRFVEERRLGRGIDRALAAMAGSSGRAVVVGAVTTAATFYAFLVTDFRGLWEMGFLTGTGILFCMASVLLLLPALFAWSEHRHARRERAPSFYLHSFGTDRLMGLALARPVRTLAVGGAVTVAAFAAAFAVRFDADMGKLRPEGNRGIEVAEQVGEKFGSGFNYMMLRVEGEDPAEVLARTAVAAEAAEELVRDGIVYRVDSISSVIPPPARQREVLAWLERGRDAGSLDFARIESTFESAVAEEGLRAAPFASGLGLLRSALAPERPMGLDDFAGTPEGRRLVERFVQPAGTNGAIDSVVYLYPARNEWRRRPPPEATALAERLGPDVVLTGSNVINERMRGRVTRDAWLAGILGFVAVGLLVFLDFRSVRYTLLALAPLAVGLVWMLGVMGAAGITLNFMNIFVTTMIIGIGVDYGLHAVHRVREMEGAPIGEWERGLSETGKAIAIAALSTICGFGSLSLSHYPGLRTTGYVAILGALATALVSLTLVPAWCRWRRRRDEVPAEHES